MIVLMRQIDPHARAVRKQFDDQVDAVVRREAANRENSLRGCRNQHLSRCHVHPAVELRRDARIH